MTDKIPVTTLGDAYEKQLKNKYADEIKEVKGIGVLPKDEINKQTASLIQKLQTEEYENNLSQRFDDYKKIIAKKYNGELSKKIDINEAGINRLVENGYREEDPGLKSINLNQLQGGIMIVKDYGDHEDVLRLVKNYKGEFYFLMKVNGEYTTNNNPSETEVKKILDQFDENLKNIDEISKNYIPDITDKKIEKF